MLYLLSILLSYRSTQASTILTSQIFVVTNIFVPPWIVASVSNALVFAYPNQPVRTVVQFWLAKLALPVPVTVLHVANQLGLDLTGVVL